ncbi:hypothetical protein D3C71_1716560 [compost metagenome]
MLVKLSICSRTDRKISPVLLTEVTCSSNSGVTSDSTLTVSFISVIMLSVIPATRAMDSRV